MRNAMRHEYRPIQRDNGERLTQWRSAMPQSLNKPILNNRLAIPVTTPDRIENCRFSTGC
jgi:hypothetical protein